MIILLDDMIQNAIIIRLLGVLVCLIMEMLTNRTHYTMANYYLSMSK